MKRREFIVSASAVATSVPAAYKLFDLCREEQDGLEPGTHEWFGCPMPDTFNCDSCIFDRQGRCHET